MLPGFFEANNAEERCQQPAKSLPDVVPNHKHLVITRFEEDPGQEQTIEHDNQSHAIPERACQGWTCAIHVTLLLLKDYAAIISYLGQYSILYCWGLDFKQKTR